MLIPLLQVLFAAISAVSRSALNVMLYSMLSRVFSKWLGLHSFITFFCSLYCISKITAYFQRMWLKARLTNKKPEEKLVLDQLTWESATTLPTKIVDQTNNKFETDWNYLLNNDEKNLFPSIVKIPFSNGYLFFGTLIAVEYQMNNYQYSYTMSLIRTLGFLIILICGSCIRYHTLYERERKIFFDYMLKNRDEFESYILYLNHNDNYIPVGSICLQLASTSEPRVFVVRLYQINSKFDDYMVDIGKYMSQKIIERVENYGNEHKKPVIIAWLLPTCKQNWKYAILANNFGLKKTYKDFSFMPFVNSHVEQYEYHYEWKEGLSDEVVNE